MPSPVAHALAGVATAWTADLIAPNKTGSPRRSKFDRFGGGLVVAAAFLGASADLDLLVGLHRTATHSLGAAVMVLAGAGIAAARLKQPIGRTALVCGIAYATHILLDWVGSDRAIPRGVMAFWPLDSTFYYAPIRLFPNVSRAYWLPLSFIYENTIALLCELAVVGLPVWGLWLVRVKTLAGLPAEMSGRDHPPQ